MFRRGNVYYGRARSGGELVRKRLSSDFEAACVLLNELKCRADKADFGLVDNDCPWDELKAAFLDWAEQNVKRPGEYKADLERFETYLKIRSVRQVTLAHVLAYRSWRLAHTAWGDRSEVSLRRSVSARTVNKEVATIKNMLNRGVELKLIGHNSLQALRPLKHTKLRKDRRSLSVEEVLAIFKASPDHLKPVWRMFMCTAIRRSELTNMRFADIDFNNRVLTVQAYTAKNHRERQIPLDDALVEMMVALRDQDLNRKSTDYVFTTTIGTKLGNNLLKAFYRVCKAAGIDDGRCGGSIDLHALRASCATLMLAGGANIKDVQVILGHATPGFTLTVYAKMTQTGKRDAINALSFASATAPVVNNHRPKSDPRKKTSSQHEQQTTIA